MRRVVTAPVVGAGSIQQINEAVTSLSITLSNDQVRALHNTETPQHDTQRVADKPRSKTSANGSRKSADLTTTDPPDRSA